MNTRVTIVERRERPRTGVIAELEDAAYRVLRKYGMDSSVGQQSSTGAPEQSA